VYVGGFGGGDDGTAVDAGFQESSVHDGSKRDNYALIFKYQGQSGEQGWSNRFVCDQEVTYSFETISPNQLLLTASGFTWVNNNRVMEPNAHVSEQPALRDGWSPSGGILGSLEFGIVVKRMVSIAQPKSWTSDAHYRNTWYKDGSYFGHSSGSTAPLIHWRACEVGRVMGGVKTWLSCSHIMTHQIWFPNFPDASIRQVGGGPNFPDDFSVAIDLG